ncbi:hypothetical protein [Conexibacter sp. CPCC 206217]|uniref:hypothetical protein n=1 Tax=Conexibacter sp. CPCC 206217 TaxID=3064574 RepID=UPI0027251E8C|nr:hypothetical protein [Conexibacter sp. CPCC 206217]MDO8212867.1 hypothetical protein [Conexibacter sp. CPCC 206217]
MTPIAGNPLATLASTPTGRRLLAVASDPRAETGRTGRRAPAMAGAIEGVAVIGDALPDLVDGRTPARIELTWPGEPAELAQKLRRRLGGDLRRRAWHDLIELRAVDGSLQTLRVIPHGRGAGGAWSDPVLTVRAAKLGLDGRIEDPTGDLARRCVRLVDPDGFRRRPEAVVHLARLGARPNWTIEPATLAAACEIRRDGAPATAPVVHVGAALATLLVCAEPIAALELLQQLAPDVPLADGVEVDGERLRAAFAAPPATRVDAVLRALAPGASRHRIVAFRAGAGLRTLNGVTEPAHGRSDYGTWSWSSRLAGCAPR